MLLFNHLNKNQFHDFMFIIVPNFMQKYAILWDPISYQYVSVDCTDDIINHLLTIDEAIDQDFLSRNEYIQILIDFNFKHVNGLVHNSIDRQSLYDAIINAVNKMTSFYGDINKLDIL